MEGRRVQMDEMRVTKVPAAFVMPKIKNVGVYCRVSTRSMEQLHSLASQVSHFTQLIRRRRDWKLYDFYIDIASGADLDNQPEFRRMMNDCENGVVNTVITKSISRFGRNTEQALISLRLLTAYYVEVIFESEGVNTSESDSELVISFIEAFAQAENDARSANIRWGIEKGAKDGTSGFFRRRCYGYRNNENGDLEIVPEEVEAVRFIFESYLNGASLNMLQDQLRKRGISPPTGKDTWRKQSVNMLLSNEKYSGDVLLMKSVNLGSIGSRRTRNEGQAARFLAMSNHPPIIDRETIEAVQKLKIKRSNVIQIEGETKRKDVRYSAKK
jgi:DNA invertase Pin-like site-specific DNA recombinase